jgi:hypothetical protein
MASKSGNSARTSRIRSTAVKAQRSVKKKGKPKPKATDSRAASERFVKDLLVRGEAAKPNRQGKLSLEATHAVTKEEKDGTVEVKRARFKYY